MTVPATAFIEIGLAELEKKFEEKQGLIWKEIKELRGLDNAKLTHLFDRMLTCNPPTAEFKYSLLMEMGYLLGLETARALLATQPNAILHNVEI